MYNVRPIGKDQIGKGTQEDFLKALLEMEKQFLGRSEFGEPVGALVVFIYRVAHEDHTDARFSVTLQGQEIKWKEATGACESAVRYVSEAEFEEKGAYVV